MFLKFYGVSRLDFLNKEAPVELFLQELPTIAF